MKWTPHEYQADGVQKIIDLPAVGLFWEMGLGKTVVTLTAINELKYHMFRVRRVLIVAPKRVAEATWTREAQKWDHLQHLRVSSVMGTAGQRIRALNTSADLYVINRENVPWLVDYLRNDWPFDMVVVDELSSFKGHDSKRFKQLRLVRPRVSRIVGLTGTPTPNGLTDLWAQVYLLDEGERLGKFVTHYREMYFNYDPYARRYNLQKGAEEAIRSRLTDLCFSLRAEDYLQLPDLVVDDFMVVLDPKARRAYAMLEEQAFLEFNEDTIDARTAAVLTGKLLQLGNGACYNDDGGVTEVHGCKIEAFSEVVEALNGDRALVFYGFRHDLPRLHAALNDTGLRVRELRTDADSVAWNNHEVDILLAHPASCAYGLNLQDGGNHVIWFGLTWSLELYQQANARIFRQGQQAQRVFIHRLIVADSADERVVEVLNDKGETQDKLLDWLKTKIKSAHSAVDKK